MNNNSILLETKKGTKLSLEQDPVWKVYIFIFTLKVHINT